MIKRIIAAVLAAATLFTAAAAFAWEQTESNVQDNAKQLLYALDIMDNITQDGYKTDDKITRGELADIVMRMSGVYQERIYSDVFDDVTDETEYAASITNLVSMGVIADGDKYYPEDTALYEHAVKMLLYLLGYEVRVEYGGGWLEAVMRTASEIGLTKGIGAAAGQELNAGMLMALCYNALDCDVLVRDLNNDFTADSDKTLLSEKLDIYKQKGIVTSTSITSLTGEGKPGKAKVGNVEVDDINNIADDFLGMEVTAYYKVSTSSDKELVFVYATGNNNIVTISSSDLAPGAAGFGYTAVYYNNIETGKLLKVKIDEEADVIYNGKAFPSYTIDDYNLESGFLKFIDNDSDNSADVVFIEETENYVVDTLDTKNSRIYDMYGKSLNLEDSETVKITDMYGEPIELGQLARWNVLSVKASKDFSLVDITAYDDPVIGDVQSIMTENGETKVTIDGETFAVAKSYENAIAANNPNAKQIVLLQSGTYYLDAEEKIAAVSLDSVSSWRYGYLIKAYYDEGSERAGFKIVYDNTGAKRIEAAENVKIDGYKKEDGEIPAYFADAGNDTIPQLIKFMMNGQGYITKIDTAFPGANETSENLTKTLSGATGYWSVRTRRVGNDQTIGVQIDQSSTLIFQVPASSADKYDEDKYSIKTSGFTNNEYITYDAYDVDSVGLAKAAVIKKDSDSKGNFDPNRFIIVSKISKVVSSEDEVQTVIKGYSFTGEEQTEILSEEVDASKLKIGDLLAYDRNYKNEIDSFVYIYHHADGTAEGKNINNNFSMGEKDIGADYSQAYRLFNAVGDYSSAFTSNAQSYLTANVIADKIGSYIKAYKPGVYFATGDKDDFTQIQVFEQSCPYYASAPVKVFLCDDNKVSEITWSDLEQYVYSRNKTARALLFSTYSQLRTVYIYK